MAIKKGTQGCFQPADFRGKKPHLDCFPFGLSRFIEPLCLFPLFRRLCDVDLAAAGCLGQPCLFELFRSQFKLVHDDRSTSKAVTGSALNHPPHTYG